MERSIREAASIDFLERILFPTLESRLDKAFPVYGFRRDAQGRWIATRRPASLPDPMRKSARLYGDRRGIRGLDAEHAFLPWITHEAKTDGRGSGKEICAAIARLAKACGVPMPDDLVSDAAFARAQRLVDLRESAWASLRAHGLMGLDRARAAMLEDVGLSVARIEDIGFEIGYCPDAMKLRAALEAKQGARSKDLYAIGLSHPRLEGALVLGLRSAAGTLEELLLVTNETGSLCERAAPEAENPGGAMPTVLYGLDVALAAKGGPEDLLVVRDPLSACALHSHGLQAVVGLVRPSVDGAVWDELVGSGVRGMRVLVRGAGGALKRVARTLGEDQLGRLRLRCLEDAESFVRDDFRIARRASEIGVQVLVEELRRLPWRDPLTSDIAPTREPELLVDEEASSAEAAPKAPEAAAGTGASAAHPAKNGKRAAKESPLMRLARRHHERQRSDADGSKIVGDASRFVQASRAWSDARVAAKRVEDSSETEIPEGTAFVPETRGVHASPGDGTDVETGPARSAGEAPREAVESARATPNSREDGRCEPPHPWQLPSLPTIDRHGVRGRVLIECADADLRLDLLQQIARDGRPQEFGDTQLLVQVGARGSFDLVDAWRARNEESALRFVAGPHAIPEDRSAPIAWELPSASALPRSLERRTRLLAFTSGSREDLHEDFDAVLRIRPWPRARLAEFFGRKEDDVFLEDHLVRCAAEGRSFHTCEVLTKSLRRRLRISVPHEAHVSRIVEGAFPYRS